MIDNNYGSEINFSPKPQGGGENKGYEKLHDLQGIFRTVDFHLKKGQYEELTEYLRDNYAKEGIRAKYENSGYSNKEQFLEELDRYPDLEKELNTLLRDMLKLTEEAATVPKEEQDKYADEIEEQNAKFKKLLENK